LAERQIETPCSDGPGRALWRTCLASLGVASLLLRRLSEEQGPSSARSSRGEG
jgi:hypothetical protein